MLLFDIVLVFYEMLFQRYAMLFQSVVRYSMTLFQLKVTLFGFMRRFSSTVNLPSVQFLLFLHAERLLAPKLCFYYVPHGYNDSLMLNHLHHSHSNLSHPLYLLRTLEHVILRLWSLLFSFFSFENRSICFVRSSIASLILLSCCSCLVSISPPPDARSFENSRNTNLSTGSLKRLRKCLPLGF